MSDLGDVSLAAAPSWDLGVPAIHGPGAFGARVNSVFFYPVPATGERPLSFEAEGLPEGAAIDRRTGVISGRCPSEGRTTVQITVKNRHGAASRTLVLEVGDKILLTPPMGWNSWNCWAERIDDAKIRAAADALVASGLAARGYSYVNIDAGWQGERGGKHNAIQGNAGFPDMAALCDYIHGKGLRAGIYSTPWVKSYCSSGEGFTGGSSGPNSGAHSPYYKSVLEKKYIGEITYEKEDAAQWAEWGFDYLKYDWVVNDVPETKRMADALRASGRDIALSLSNSAPFSRAAELAALANCWRLTGDITDTWESVCSNGFGQEKWTPYAGPGHWNDPDMLVVGRLGWGNPRPCRLSPDEQITHISLWALLSAPLIVGCDPTAFDDFTLRLLCNDEVIAIDQDLLGEQARPIRDLKRLDIDGNLLEHRTLYAKRLSNGDFAAGLFNRGPEPAKIRLEWSDLGLTGKRKVRDLWAQKDLGTFSDALELDVPAHGARLTRLSAP